MTCDKTAKNTQSSRMSEPNYYIFLLLVLFYHATPTSCDSSPCTCPTSRPSPVTIQLFPMIGHTITNNIGKEDKPPKTPPSHEEEQWYAIKTAASGLVLDGRDPIKMTIQEYTGSPQQLWRFQRANRPGVYYIFSNSTGSVLEYNPGNLEIILKEKTGFSNQHWILNSNGRIFNVGAKYNIDVTDARYVPGNLVHVWKDNGNQAQEFVLQEKSN